MTSDTRLSDQHPELFHYTTVSAFESIYRQRKFRATHYEDLNDTTELGRFRLAVGKFIRPLVLEIFAKRLADDAGVASAVREDGGVDAVVDREAEIHLNTLQQNTFGKTALYEDTFISSFCAHDPRSDAAHHGLLSQWRGYGGDGGIAIVLDARAMEYLMKEEAGKYAHLMNHIGDVKYDNDEQGITKEFHEVFENLPEALKAVYAGEDASPWYEKMHTDFAMGTTLVKHHAFFEEREVRIVVSPRASKGSRYHAPEHDEKPVKTIRYAPRANHEIRYIELFGGASLPIKRVIVGPSRKQNFNRQTVAELVSGTGIDVVLSEIPFVG